MGIFSKNQTMGGIGKYCKYITITKFAHLNNPKYWVNFSKDRNELRELIISKIKDVDIENAGFDDILNSFKDIFRPLYSSHMTIKPAMIRHNRGGIDISFKIYMETYSGIYNIMVISCIKSTNVLEAWFKATRSKARKNFR